MFTVGKIKQIFCFIIFNNLKGNSLCVIFGADKMKKRPN